MTNQFDNDRTQSLVVLSSGTKVGHYRVIEKTGAGGMGEVYLAEDTQLNRRVALKFLSAHLAADEKCKARFRREAQAAAALNHENIVTIHEVSEYRGRPFFSMQYIEGQSLRDLIKTRSLDLRESVQLVCRICKGLSEAHRSGITHRDIKPSNVVVDSNGYPRLVDFGLASIQGSERLTGSGSVFGTVGYMAPEMVRGEPTDSRSDIFSLGVVLYELVTGLQPFRRDSDAATLHAIAYESPAPVAVLCPEAPDRLQRLIAQAMEKDRDKRYQKVDDLLDDLRSLRSALDAGVHLSTRRSFWSNRLRWPVRRIASFSLLAIVALVMLLSPGSRNAVLSWFGLEPVPNQRHLAVLPFTDLGEPVLGQAFCDGLVETLSSKLTQMEQFHGSLWVVPASEVREQNVSSADHARRRFGVNLVVSGSMQRFEESVRMTLNLIDTKSERQLRSSVIDHPLNDWTALQDSTIMVLADMLEVQLRPRDHRTLTAGSTGSPAAYYSYLQARGYLQRHEHDESAESIDTAIGLFNRAIDLDSNYALAYAGLGEAYWHKYDASMDAQWVDPAVRYSRLAHGLSDKLAPVHVTLGLIHQGMGQYEDAVGFFEQALQIDSVNHAAQRGLALAYESLGEYDLAEATYLRAIELKPDSWGGYFDLAFSYFSTGRNQDAQRFLRKADSLAPSATMPLNNLGALYLYLGQTDEARARLEHSIELEPNYAAYSNLGTINQMEELYSEAAEMYVLALELDDRDYRVWINLALIYKAMPDQDEAALSAYRSAAEMAEAHRTVNPNDPIVLCHLAECYAAIGEREQALTLAEQATTLAPGNIEVAVRASVVYDEIGRRDEALASIAKAVEHGIPLSEFENYDELRELLADPRFDSLVSKK